MGVPVDGLPVVGYTKMDDWGELCSDLLGHRPSNRDLGGNKNTAVMERPRVVCCLWTSLVNGSQLCICNFSIQSATERIIVGVVQH